MNANLPPPLASPEPGPGRSTAVCRECGCENDWSASECWLCGRSNWRPGPHERLMKVQPTSGSGLNLITVMLAVLIVAILLGVARESPEGAIFLSILAAGALIYTTIKVRRYRSMNVPVSNMRAFGLFLSSWVIFFCSFVILAVLFGIAVAIALFGYCACTAR